MSTPILSSIAILCGGCVDIPLSSAPPKRKTRSQVKNKKSKKSINFAPDENND